MRIRAPRPPRLPAPSARTGRVLRILTLVAFLVACLLAVRFVVPSDDESEQAPRLEEGELTVGDAIGLAPQGVIVVRGYVFSGPGARELRMCNGRRGGDPPRCVGPFISLYEVNEGAFALESAETEDGEVLYSEQPVGVSGTLVGTAMDVRLVLGRE